MAPDQREELVLLRELAERWQWRKPVVVNSAGSSFDVGNDLIAAAALLRILEEIKKVPKSNPSPSKTERRLGQIIAILKEMTLRNSPEFAVAVKTAKKADREKASRDRAWQAYLKAGGNPNPEEDQTPIGRLTLASDPWELNLCIRGKKLLNRLNIKTIGDLVKYSGDELLGCKNFGMASLSELRDRLAKYGLHLRGDRLVEKIK